MFNVNTVIGINSAMSRPSGNRKKDRMDYRKELQEIIKMVDAAKLRLGDVSCEMDVDDLDTSAIDEAMDAMDKVNSDEVGREGGLGRDVIDILEDVVEEE